jgi:hypothetical protein
MRPTGVVKEESKMSDQKPSGDSSRRNFLTGAAVASAAIVAPTVKAQAASNKKNRGVYADPKGTTSWDDKVADFSYTNDALAQLIVDMWAGFHGDLLKAPAVTDYKQRSLNAKAVLAARGILLELPIVITEKEFEDGFRLADADLLGTNGENLGVVLVVPEKKRATIGAPLPADPAPLLETAKMLMAVTPNGI